jgi:hypothetical protein
MAGGRNGSAGGGSEGNFRAFVCPVPKAAIAVNGYVIIAGYGFIALLCV